MNTNPVPFPQEAAGPAGLCMEAWLQDAKDLQREGEDQVGGKESQAGVAAPLAHGAALSQGLRHYIRLEGL